MADNFHFDITGASLDRSLEIAFTHHKKALYWVDTEYEDDRANKRRRLILLWAAPQWASAKAHPFPAPITADQAVDIVKSWLAECDYGPEPDHDGDNGKGWRIYNESWGHVAGHWEAFVAIEPVWLMYGK